jgi:hypothetical protein
MPGSPGNPYEPLHTHRFGMETPMRAKPLLVLVLFPLLVGWDACAPAQPPGEEVWTSPGTVDSFG